MSKKTKEFITGLQPTLRELKFSLYRLKRSPLSIMGFSIIGFFVVLALLAPMLAPTPLGDDPNMMPKDGFLQWPLPPSNVPMRISTFGGKYFQQKFAHPFGTTKSQYDIFYGCIWGTRNAFRVGIWVTFTSLAIGLVVGIFAGYYGGVIDELMMRFTDIILAFPGLILAMAMVAVLYPAVSRADAVLLALVLVGWPGYTRVIRGEVLRVKTEDYVEAAKAVGCSDLRTIFKHVIPNSIYPILIIASLDIGSVVLTVAALSFLNLGPPEGFADWGQLISFSRNFIIASPQDPYKYWYTYIIPGIFIFTFVLGWNLLGDALRDILDPTLRRK
jgi:peptide/nickel transport system permease protein